MTLQFGDPRLPPRFWSKVAIDGWGCWIWTASVATTEYPIFLFDSQREPGKKRGGTYVYRAVLELVHGWAPRYRPEHTCSSGRACVNPAHMRPNAADFESRLRLRHGSVASQLENDRFDEDEGDEFARAHRRGWNCAIDKVLYAHREQRAFSTVRMVAGDSNDASAAFARGHNAGLRHALDVLRVEQGLRELAYAPVIRTIGEPLVELGGTR